MMFQDDTQRAQVCLALLRSLGLQRLWTEEGPTDEALRLYEKDGGHLSSGERSIFLLSWSFWTGCGLLNFSDLLRLDQARLEAVGALFSALAIGPLAIDHWISQHGADEP
tara:strand:+ start:16557 stop:16886 length:330 start_codon:yes stop_codon:yes gene_type:complete